MIEDDDYRSSSQYRYWSYPQATLDTIRSTTNALAAEKVKEAFNRAWLAQNGQSDSAVAPEEYEVKTLTAEEELTFLEWGCSKIIEMGDQMRPRIPPNILATAIQYLRRFYLSNSPMTYHPKQMIPCALFLATKADHFYIPLQRFVACLDDVPEDAVKSPEFLIMQGLRFTLDVRHPMRGLEGGVAEVQALYHEDSLGSLNQQTAAGANDTAKNIDRRIGEAADKAKTLLRQAAQMTDAYFLFTPSQIWLGALYATDSELAKHYLDHVFKRLGENLANSFQEKLISTIEACANMLSSYKTDDPSKTKEIRRIGRKLNACQNPEKKDIVAFTRARAAEKREGNDSDRDAAIKKRKSERERAERDGDVFGPDLKSIK